MAGDFLSTYHTAQTLLASGQVREAAELCRELLAVDSKSSHGHYLMSQVFMASGHPDKAAAFAKRAVQYAPDVAEFQLQHARALQQLERFPEAERAYRLVLRLNPDYNHLQGDLFNVLIAQQKHHEARVVLDTLLQLKPYDPSLHHMRASLDGYTTSAAPPEFISALFDGAAESFDYHMREDLSYRTPGMIAGLVKQVVGEDTAELSLLDLGCGTGLAAEALQDMSGRRAGVDLSERMLAQAHNKLLYVELYRRDMVEFMLDSKKTYELIVAADVLVYTGNLVPFLSAARQTLAPHGLLVFSVERDDTTDAFRLHVSGRYGHSADYVQTMLYNAGYELIIHQDGDLRSEDGKPVFGTVLVARRAHEIS